MLRRRSLDGPIGRPARLAVSPGAVAHAAAPPTTGRRRVGKRMDISYVSRDSHHQFGHSGIVVLIVNAKRDDMLSRRQLSGQIAERFSLLINDAVLGEDRPPISGIDRNLRLRQGRRLICRLDSNSNPAVFGTL